MVNRDERGSVGLLVALGVTIMLFVIAAVFGIWSYASRQDYKDNSDQKSAAAVALAVKQEDTKKDADFVEQEKNPLRTYTGPEAYGKLTIKYPKTWSALVDEGNSGGIVLNGFMQPDFVPGLQSNTNFALRFQILQTGYSEALRQYDSQVRGGTAKVSPYVAPKVPGITGARIDGQIDSQKKGSLVLLPLRDKTIKIWTESDQFFGDFNNIILANITFTP